MLLTFIQSHRKILLLTSVSCAAIGGGMAGLNGAQSKQAEYAAADLNRNAPAAQETRLVSGKAIATNSISDSGSFSANVDGSTKSKEPAPAKTSGTIPLPQTATAPASATATSTPPSVNFVPRGYLTTRLRMGNERSLGSTEVFYPIGWNGRMLGFADIRLTAATDSSIEGNIGFGLRRLNQSRTGIWGLYGYFDRRRTEHDNNFSQLTIGSEYLANNWEARLNTYIPLNGNQHRTMLAPTTFALVGTTLVATGGNTILTEIPNYGVDTEFGARLPIPSYDYLNNVWGYAGGYYFDSDETDAIIGYRLRAKADITDKISIGAEWRQDNVRDNELLVEARLTYTFGGKEKQQAKDHSPILDRMTQQPYRDVDIVVQSGSSSNLSSETIVSTESGTAQRILTVDNTASAGGDGSTTTPYHTLADATAAAQAGDIIYVRYGDGTSTGMNAGATLGLNGISLIGSGSALTYDNTRMNLSGRSFNIPNGTTILARGLSPVLTNTAATSDILTITADDILVSGLTLSNATRNGINISVTGAGNDINGTILRDLDIESAANNGINISSATSAVIDSLTMDGLTVHNSGAIGLSLAAIGSNSTISDLAISDSTFSESHTNGIQAIASIGGDITTASLTNSTVSSSGDYGVYFQITGTGSTLSGLSIAQSTISDSGNNGFYLLGQSAGQISNTTVSRTTISSSGNDGMNALLQNTGTTMSGLTVANSTISGSATNGLIVQAQAGTTIDTTRLSDTVLDNNHDQGLYLLSTGASALINHTTLSGLTVRDSGLIGTLVQASTGGQLNNTNSTNLLISGSGSHGLQVYSLTSNALIDNTSFTNTEVTNSGEYGVYLQNSATADMTDISFNGLDIRDTAAVGMAVTSTNSGSSIDNLDLADLSIDNSGTVGFFMSATSTGQITNTDIGTTEINNSGTHGLQINAATSTGTINNLAIANTSVNNSGSNGIYMLTTATGVLSNLTLSNISTLHSSDIGMAVTSTNTSSLLDNLTVSNLTLTDSGTTGLYLNAATAGQLTDASFTNTDISDTGGSGLSILSSGTSALLDNLTMNDTTIDLAGINGAVVQATSTGIVSDLTLQGLNVSNSADNGVYFNSQGASSQITNVTLDDASINHTRGANGLLFYAQSASSIQNATLSDITVNDAGDRGIYFLSETTGSLLNNLSLTNATIDETGLDGLRAYSSTGGDMTNVALSQIDISDSGENGIYLQSTTSGSILSGMTLDDITVTGSAAAGIYIQGSTSGLLSASLENVTSTANYDNAIYVDDDTTASFVVDLGGGTLGSTGGNRFFNNYLQEIRLDYDGGAISAQNNWWGSATGLAATKKTLEVSSTINTTGFLTTDPGP